MQNVIRPYHVKCFCLTEPTSQPRRWARCVQLYPDAMGSAELDAALEAAWDGRSPASLAGGTLAGVISREKPRMFSSARQEEAMKLMAPGTEVIKMGGGMPDHGFLDIAMPQLLDAAQVAWTKSQPEMLEYDFGSGVAALKEGVADYLTRTREQECTSEEILISTGNMGGIQLACQAYLGPETICVVESPLFSVSGRIAAATGATIEPVGMDDKGIDVEALEAVILGAEATGKRVAMVYCQPIWHNPVGVCISLERATALLSLCAAHSVVVLADEAYEAYNFDSAPPPVYLSALSKGRGVISVHSFSKTIGTGLRIGYLHSAPELLAPLGSLAVDHPSVVLQHAIAELISSGAWEKHLTLQRNEYQQRLEVLCDGINEHCDGLVSFIKPTGGFFLWISLHEGLEVEDVYIAGVRHGLTMSQGPNFYWETDPAKPSDKHLRLAFTSSTQEQLSEAMRRLGAACKDVKAGTREAAPAVAVRAAL